MKIPAGLNPSHIDYIRAKSDDMGGDTLAEHTWEVLSRLADQYRLRGDPLTNIIQDERLWHHLYWGCFLHDFGKAAAGFQERLLPNPPENIWKEQRHRHEVLSLAFVDWLFPRGNPDRLPVLGIIATHHKDLSTICDKYGAIYRDTAAMNRLAYLVEQLTPEIINDLWYWLTEYGLQWQTVLGFEKIIPVQFAQTIICVDAIADALDDLYDFAQDQKGEITAFYLRGAILTSDHSASAGAPPFPDMPMNKGIAERPTRKYTLLAHQAYMQTCDAESMIMIAPTGSGKTEAAMLWAGQQLALSPSARIFYTLPYQASMNAMADRLWKSYFAPEDAAVGFTDESNQVLMIQHSRATLRLYQLLMEADDTDSQTAARVARHKRNLSQLNYYPIQIFSPYQMLKAVFSLKGYEALLLDYAGALFIFDEIHAYEPRRLAMIIETIRWLREKFHARFLMMTATLAPHLRELLAEALGVNNAQIVQADNETFKRSERHQVFLLDGSLFDHIDQIIADYNEGKTVLVCCNQVPRVMEIYEHLVEFVGESSILLLHSRFHGGDRSRLERALTDEHDLGVGWWRKNPIRKPFIVVATQVVEVSLNIDLDVLYTEPAPLEALLQRFGRVNRGRTSGLCPVYVARKPDEGKDTLPYDDTVIRASLNVLAARDGQVIDESRVTEMLGQIYQGAVLTQWKEEYDESRSDFLHVLEQMKPFESADKVIAMRFYELFDGIQVLPADCANDYEDAYETGGFLAASQYLVNISWKQYHMMRYLVIGQDERTGIPHVNVPYTERGLDIYSALQQKDEDE